MGQTASAKLAELTECVIDPPQNVSKESEQKEAEMLPELGALRLKETREEEIGSRDGNLDMMSTVNTRIR